MQAIKTRTTTGTEVTLTPTEYCGTPTVRVEFDHPAMGHVIMSTSRWADGKTHSGAAGHVGSTTALITVPKADYERALAAAHQIGEDEIAALKSGAVKFSLRYYDGEILGGHTLFGRAANLLVELGLAKEVEGWGTHVPAAAVEALGTEFTYEQARAYADALHAPRLAKEAEAEQRRAVRLTELAATARPAGQKQVVSRQLGDDSRDGQGTDVHTEWIDGDGNLTYTTHSE